MRFEERAAERDAMLRFQLEARDIQDPKVLDAMRRVPRHAFVPAAWQPQAYEDHPLPLGPGQTISQPYIVAFMAQALALDGSERVLEVGSGCGYGCAVLSLLAREVCGIELDTPLAERSALTLESLGCANVQVRAGDGALGWPGAPFDALLLSCAAPVLPEALWNQLRAGGRALFPQDAGLGFQNLVLLTKTAGGPERRSLLPVAFVPLR